MSLTRVVTFLGKGGSEAPHYTPCRYELDGMPCEETPLHDVIDLLVARKLGEVSLVVLGTAEVREQWFGPSQIYLNELDRLGFRDIPVGFVELPWGRTEEERWTLFRAIQDVLAVKPLILEVSGRETVTEGAPPSRIFFDVTHGFRSQSILATAAVEFVQSEWLRNQLADPPLLRVLYAAFESRDGGIAPVWDLTQLTQAHAWNRAIDGLMRYGRADDLQRLLNETQKEENQRLQRLGGKQRYPQLRKLGDESVRFADALATSRVGSLLTENATGLSRAIENNREDVARMVPPLVPQLERLAVWADALRCQKVISREGVRAALALGEVYRQTERYTELAALLRETAVTLWTLQNIGETALEPSTQGFRKQRLEQEHELGRICDQDNVIRADDPLAVWIFKKILVPRNDCQHGGFNENPSAATKLRNNLIAILDEFRQRFDADGSQRAT